MGKRAEEGPAKDVKAAEPEEEVDTQREWDLDHRKWKVHVFGLAAGWPVSFLGGFMYALIAADARSTAGLVFLVTGLIMILLLAMSAFHGFKYYKATGKWI